MILSAGLGTRLRPLTDALPKPLVWVGARPALAHVLSSIAPLGARATVINSFYNAPKLHEFVGLSSPHCLISEEDSLLGTAGGVARARDRGLLGENDAVLVWNGDMLSELSAVALASAHDRAHRESHAFATLAIRRRPAGEGSVGLTVEGRVVRLRKTSSGPEEHGGDFLGISVLSNACLNALPRLGCLVGDAWIPAMLRGDYIHGWYTDAHTADVGNIQDYAKENFRWLASQVTPTTGLFRGSYIGVGATVDRATNSIVGAGARVRGSVNNSIVWPTMEVDGPLDGVIVGPGFRVPIPQG